MNVTVYKDILVYKHNIKVLTWEKNNEIFDIQQIISNSFAKGENLCGNLVNNSVGFHFFVLYHNLRMLNVYEYQVECVACKIVLSQCLLMCLVTRINYAMI